MIGKRNSKRCSKCGKTKPLTEFHKNRSFKDGLTCWCKGCVATYDREYREANPEKVAAYLRKYREGHKEEIAAKDREYRRANPEKVAARQRKYREDNPERVAAASREWYANNREKALAADRERYRANPEPHKRRARERRARKAGAEGSHTEAEFKALVKQMGGRCPGCGRRFSIFLRPTRDHIVPLSWDGSDDISNIQPLCMRCNDRKGTKTIDYR